MKMTMAGTGAMSARRRRLNPQRAAVAIVALLLVIYPFWVGDYQISVARDALIFGILALSLDFLWGKAGILSFGQAAFFGIGAYAVAILGPRIGGGDAFLFGLAAGLAVAALVAGAVGYFLLYGGVRGPYLTIVTLALSLVAERIATGWAKGHGWRRGLARLSAARSGLARIYLKTGRAVQPILSGHRPTCRERVRDSAMVQWPARHGSRRSARQRAEAPRARL
jgi:ABC-type branched-subunit amino acid transport system permease subunit